MLDSNKRLIEKYYNELWNPWNFELADQILARDVTFHGSVGVSVQGLEGFRQYMRLIQAAFPDFHNSIDELIAQDDRVAGRLTYHGTHQGTIFGVAPTGTRIAYSGLALFRIVNGRIVDGFVLGDVIGLLSQLGVSLTAR